MEQFVVVAASVEHRYLREIIDQLMVELGQCIDFRISINLNYVCLCVTVQYVASIIPYH